MRLHLVHAGMVVVVLSAACTGGSTTTTDGSSSDPTAAPTSSATATEPTANGLATPTAIPTIATLVRSQGPDEYGNGFSVEYPLVRGIDPAIADRINAAIVDELAIDDLAVPPDAAETSQAQDGIPAWDEQGSFATGMKTPQLLSFQIDQYLYTGGAHGLPASWFLTFELATGELVEAFELLAPDARDVLSPLVKADLDERFGDEHYGDEDVLTSNEAWSAGFAVDGSLVIVYQPYGIGPYAMGLPTFTFTPGELRQLDLVPSDGPLAAALDAATEDQARRAVALEEAVARHRSTGEACDGEADPEAFEPLHLEFRINGETVVFVRCWDAAYQSLWEAMGWNGAALERIPVEQWRDGEVVDTPIVLGYPELGDRTIVNVTRARGVGDCGTRQEWWVDEAGLTLVAVQERECTNDGEFVPPDEWPFVGP